MKKKSLIVLLILLSFISIAYAKSVCNNSVIVVKNDTDYPLKVVHIKHSSTINLQLAVGQKIPAHSTFEIYIHTKKIFIFEGHMQGEIDFDIADHGKLQFYSSLLDTVNRTPEFVCRVNRAEAFVTDTRLFKTKVTVKPAAELLPGHINVSLKYVDEK